MFYEKIEAQTDNVKKQLGDKELQQLFRDAEKQSDKRFDFQFDLIEYIEERELSIADEYQIELE